MEIGGCDTVYMTDDPVALTKQVMSFVRFKIMEFVEGTGGKEFFYYKDQDAKDAWDADLGPENVMIYFMVRDNYLSICTDKELTDRIRTQFPAYEKE